MTQILIDALDTVGHGAFEIASKNSLYYLVGAKFICLLNNPFSEIKKHLAPSLYHKLVVLALKDCPMTDRLGGFQC